MASSAVRLTRRVVEQADAQRRPYLIPDSEVRGFACKIAPSGRRTYLLFYRTREGHQRRPTIGTHGAITVEQARAIAKTWLADVIRGSDPSRERQLARRTLTMAELGRKFIEEYSAVHKKASSCKEDGRILRKHLNPYFGTQKAASITRADVLKLHNRLKETPYEANRVLATMSKMFNMAEAWGVRPDGSNPVRHVRRFRERKRERFLNHEELSRIGAALECIEATRPALLSVIHAIRLLALTGCRVGEILSLRWDWIDRAAGIIRLPDGKTGARTIPLGDAALRLLEALPRSAQPWVILNGKGSGPLAKPTLEHAWAKIRLDARIEDARLHDFRHTVGTYGGQAGFNAFTIRGMLGHKTLSMTGRYVERDVEPMRRAASAVAERVAQQLLRRQQRHANDNEREVRFDGGEISPQKAPGGGGGEGYPGH